MGHEIPPAAQPMWRVAIAAYARRAQEADRRPRGTSRERPARERPGRRAGRDRARPYTCMLLADAGADVIRVDRATGDLRRPRPRRRIGTCSTGAADRSPSTSSTPRGCAGARPRRAGRRRWSRDGGRAWPSGSGSVPMSAWHAIPRLVYGRMTGWGQDGPLASARRPRHQLHRPGGRARGPSAGAGSPPSRRSTWSGTSAVAGCCSPSGCARPSSRPGRRAVARWSTRPWSTERPRS